MYTTVIISSCVLYEIFVDKAQKFCTLRLRDYSAIVYSCCFADGRNTHKVNERNRL